MPAATELCPYLFVYGTLRQAANSAWSRLLSSVSDLPRPARARGSLFRISHYPGFVASPAGEWVIGEVHRLHDPAAFLPQLDAYEGCGPADPPPQEYRREIIQVILDSGESLDAWAYIYSRSTAGKMRIASGDYLSDVG